MEDSTLVKQAYKLQKEDNNSQFEWAATIKYLLSKLELSAFWNNPESVSTLTFSKLCASKLKDMFVTEWRSNLNHGSNRLIGHNKLRFYKQFKYTFRFEPYLHLIPNFQLRKVISKFRCSDHDLEIEKGRHKKLKIEDRICKTCKTAIESEEHFLRFCPDYGHLRQGYFPQTNSFLQWVEILKCDNKLSAFNLANFLSKSFKIRKALVKSN